MTWVKICGITNLEDALVAVDAGADAVGFVFYEKSPRYVTVEKAREIVSKLPEGVEKVGVFAGQPLEQVVQIARLAAFTALQDYPLSGIGADQHSRARAVGVDGLKVYWAFPMAMFLGEGARNVAGFLPQTPKPDLSMMKAYPEPMPGLPMSMLLDSGGFQHPGGTGEAFDWHEARSAVKQLSSYWKIVVAGGLTPENVGEAIETLAPWGVDVVSGVEARPGKKDPEKVRAFVRAVRECDRRAS